MENKYIRISVIVTIHNAEKYIVECMSSLINQTFSQIEILCMDGGSTDNTPEILQQYADTDSRVRIINDANTSYGHKVNRGIEEAKGEYISVLESDDMYELFMLEKLYDVAERYHTDFVNADYTNFFDMNEHRFTQVVKMYAEENYNCLIDYKEHPERFGTIPRYWTGLFRKSYLNQENIRMNESSGASYQDMSFRFLTSILAQRAYHLNIPVYLYRIDNPDSSMYDAKKTVVIADEHAFLKSELIRRNITNSYVWHNAYQWKYTDFRGNMGHLKGKYRQELFDRYREELAKDRESLNNYRNHGYSKVATAMMTGTPEEIEKLIEADVARVSEEWKCLREFLNRIIQLDTARKIVVFGCGKMGSAVLELIKFADNQICCLTDNSQSLWNTVKNNHCVLSPEETIARYPNALYIVANKFHAEDIVQQLSSMGIREDMIYIYGK